MMSAPSNAPVTNQVAVISPRFCAENPVDLMITRKMMTLSEGTFVVTDPNGNIIFNIKGKSFSLHERRVLLDAAGKTVVTFHQKVMTAHRRWQCFRGESTDEKDVIFEVKKSAVHQLKTKLDITLASNKNTEVSDFRIEGSLWENSCTIYAANTDAIIAQMHKKMSTTDYLIGKDTFGMTVYPNVDHAFIVALVVILQEINQDRNKIV